MKMIIDIPEEESGIKVKQCPLCGGNPFVLKMGYATRIQCVKDDHTVEVSTKNEKEAYRIWNRRVSDEDSN